MNFKEEIRNRTEIAESLIRKYLPKEEGFARTMAEAVNYSMLAGGKRLRPILMLETFRLFGGTEKTIEPFMAAMEMIHTHSLIHDDLPAIDNDLYRRGRKTTHAVYGEAMGVLSGDAGHRTGGMDAQGSSGLHVGLKAGAATAVRAGYHQDAGLVHVRAPIEVQLGQWYHCLRKGNLSC